MRPPFESVDIGSNENASVFRRPKGRRAWNGRHRAKTSENPRIIIGRDLEPNRYAYGSIVMIEPKFYDDIYNTQQDI